jgi:hypothetical protein
MISLTAQQISFFAKNGSLELEGLLTGAECQMIRHAFQGTERDLWRKSPPLKTLLLSRKLSGLALSLTAKNSLHLALDHWFPSGYCLPQPTKLKDLFSIQGLNCALFLRVDNHEVSPSKTPIGLFPFPKAQGDVLFVNPNLLLNWPETPAPLYLVAYAQAHSVFVHNPQDTAGTALRGLGYEYGDTLRNDAHPLIQKN